MTRYLVDTTLWIDFFKNRSGALAFFSSITLEDDVFSSVLSITELRAGWNQKAARKYLPFFYDISKVFAITANIAEKAGEFRQVYKKKGKVLTVSDTLIAATAIEHDCVLITQNKKDFPMPEIIAFDPYRE